MVSLLTQARDEKKTNFLLIGLIIGILIRGGLLIRGLHERTAPSIRDFFG